MGLWVAIFLCLFKACFVYASEETVTGWVGAHEYRLFVPQDLNGPAPLFVFVHGCKETAEEFLNLTRILSQARKHRFIVIAPNQNGIVNSDRCWNWWYLGNQTRSYFHETGTIIGMVNWVRQWHPVDPSRVFVVGFSSGAATAANLAVCWPDVFAGVALHSGLAYRIVTGSSGAEKALVEDPKIDTKELGRLAYACASRDMDSTILRKVIVIHGKMDKRVIPSHAGAVFGQMKVLFDLEDDKKFNHSLNLKESVEKIYPSGKHSYEWTHAQGPYSIQMDKLMIDDMAHFWSGGDDRFPLADKNGIDMTEFIMERFLK